MYEQREGVGQHSDADLVEAVRQGNREAFGELYVRYRVTAQRFARALLNFEQGADDLVAEAFAKVLERLAAGGGPDTAFRSYLMMTVRTTLYKQWAADRMLDRRVEISALPTPIAVEDPLVDQLEVNLVARALHSLPTRAQMVLRYLEIEELAPATVARTFGIQTNAVYALAFRARDALRIAYLQVHVNTNVSANCREAADNLASWLCGRLGRGMRARVEKHIERCEQCSNSAEELSDLLAGLRRVIPPAPPAPSAVPSPRRPEATAPAFGPFDGISVAAGQARIGVGSRDAAPMPPDRPTIGETVR